MKKLTLIALTSLLAACTQSGITTTIAENTPEPVATETTKTVKKAEKETLSTKNFIGDWTCSMDGDKVASKNQVKLSEGGKATYQGKIALPAGNHTFHYALQRVGTWAYKNDVLAYHFTQSNVTRAHSSKTEQAMKSSKSLRATEKNYFDTINKELAKRQDIDLKVSKFSGKSFVMQQRLAKSNRSGSCVKSS
ncbi:hypothetical protein A1D22_07890 [Pasteurellaceae bacterium LFhippo2]|nr:hypothetical protein [Pasteurellaceae bacterium LFhippo2]